MMSRLAPSPPSPASQAIALLHFIRAPPRLAVCATAVLLSLLTVTLKRQPTAAVPAAVAAPAFAAGVGALLL
jgi:hypothetical protein